ncbi:unnamed protein product, partial [Rotaria sordida]
MLIDDDDDATSPYGNLHLEEISIPSDDKNDNEESHSSKLDSDDINIAESSPSISFNPFNISSTEEDYDDDANELYSSHELRTTSTAISPFLCDPY